MQGINLIRIIERYVVLVQYGNKHDWYRRVSHGGLAIAKKTVSHVVHVCASFPHER